MFIDKKIMIFLTVADSGSFSRAARKLGLSQSVVSFHMESLEKELGVMLFNREGRSISMTPEGNVLYREGMQLSQTADRMENILKSESTAISQRINLAGDALTCSYTLPWTLGAFREKYPNVIFSYRHMSMESLIEDIVDGDLDIGLCGYPVQNRKLVSRECFRDNIVLVSSPDGSPDILSAEALRDVPLIWNTSDRGLEYALARSLGGIGIQTASLTIFMEVEDLPMTKTFLRAGVGLAFLPRVTVEDELRFGLLKTVQVPGLTVERKTQLLYRKTDNQRKIVARFIESINRIDIDRIETMQLNTPSAD